MKKFHKILMYLILSVFLVAGMISSANALPLGPSDAILFGSDPTNPNADDIAAKFGYPDGYSYYKSEADGKPDSGNFASSYNTSYLPTDDPEDATISYVGDPLPYITAADPLYLVVKDGNHSPIWYVFDITVDGIWDGMDDIVLTGFWPNGGAISHIEIVGTNPVPEPATMILVGFGLISLAGFGRKKFFKRNMGSKLE